MQRFALRAFAALLTFGCAANTQDRANCPTVQADCQKAAAQGLIQTIGNDYMVWEHSGRIYVIGQPATNAFFAEHRHLPYTKTLIGARPQGQTVVFEVDKKNAGMTERLQQTLNNRPFPVQKLGDDFFVYHYDGRIYVIGSAKTNVSFLAHKHLPYTKTLIGAGPYGETVIFEVDKKQPALTNRLEEQYL